MFCSVIKVNGKLEQPNPGRTADGRGFTGANSCVLPLDKELGTSEELAESEGLREHAGGAVVN